MARWKKRPMADHALRADDCRRHPSVWIEIGSYNCSQSAKSTARQIRSGADRLRQYQPGGAFETRVVLTEDGAVLYARYMGPVS